MDGIFTSLSMPVLFGQVLVGLINGAFYAVMCLGLSLVFGMLRIINFAHGAQYMLGAVLAYFLLTRLGIGYWGAMIIAPALVAAVGMVIERLLLRRLTGTDPLYGLLMTFGLALIAESAILHWLGATAIPYPMPDSLKGGTKLSFMFLPTYRAWVVCVSLVLCVAVWLALERTRLGSYLRAATDNPVLVQNFGLNVPLMLTLTYGAGAGLAALAGVLAAPIYGVSFSMGSGLLITVFAAIVIGGMNSILGATVSGLALGLIEGLTKVLYPPASSVIVFVVMILVLTVRPQGLFGRQE
ncbi:High-affinity branched-chain amino acid transport system permease protein LivH [compost metagenome]|uniref:branched-chain amino acid ABC transporter permease n=1 Tax=Cupriavidus necator TaxID=106590 RepID=UPI0028B645AE